MQIFDHHFKDEVAKKIGLEAIKPCYTCGACTAVCPVHEVIAGFDPRRMIHMILLGMRKEILSSDYKSFSLKPRGRHIVKVCLGTACHLNGAVQNLEQIGRNLNICEGETTGDREFSLETVNCVGICALAPVAMVDEDYYGAMTPGKVEKMLSAYVDGSEVDERDKD